MQEGIKAVEAIEAGEEDEDTFQEKLQAVLSAIGHFELVNALAGERGDAAGHEVKTAG